MAMKLEYPHSFTKDEATARIKALTQYWDRKYGIRSDWQGNTTRIVGKVKIVSFDGTFTLEDRMLRGEVKVSFGGELIGRPYIEKKLSEYLDPKTSLESLQALA